MMTPERTRPKIHEESALQESYIEFKNKIKSSPGRNTNLEE